MAFIQRLFSLKLLPIFALLVLLPGSVISQVHFVANKNQWPEPFAYRAKIPGGMFYLSQNRFIYCLTDFEKIHDIHHGSATDGKVSHHAVQVNFEGANAQPVITESDPTSFYYNYFLEKNPETWVSRLYGYQTLVVKDIYPKVDLELLGKNDGLKYNFIVHPGGNPASIKMAYSGADDLNLENGELVIQTSLGKLKESAPEAWQISNGKKKTVSVKWQLEGNQVGFSFAEGYDPNLLLYIDPEVIFSTYSGSNADNFGYTATFDQQGNAYSGGTAFGPQFPATTGAFETTFQGGVPEPVSTGFGEDRDVGILKYSPDGTQLLFATYLGGSHNEDPHSMVVNNKNELIVFGNTGSPDFPVTPSAYDTSFNGAHDIYVVKFSEDGTNLLAGTYVGGAGEDGLNHKYDSAGLNLIPLKQNYGDDFRGEVIADTDNSVFVATCTQSEDFPVSSNAFQPAFGGDNQDGCIFKLSDDLSSLLWSSFLGGEGDDAAFGITVSEDHSVYVCGGTESSSLFQVTSAYQDANRGGEADAFVCHIDADGTSILHGTFLGTSSYDQAYFIQQDISGNIYIAGQTDGPGAFPVHNTQYIDDNSGQFITKINGSLTDIIYSTLFGNGSGKALLSPSAFLVDKCERLYFSGWGGNTNSPPFGPGGDISGLRLTDDAFQKSTDGSDFYLAVWSREMESLLYATYWGSPNSDEHVDGGTSRFDKNAIVYQSVCAGCGGDDNFPTTPGVWSNTNNSSNCNNAIFKIDLEIPLPDFTWSLDSCVFEYTFEDISGSESDKYWIFPDGSTSEEDNPGYFFTEPGSYPVSLILNKGTACEDTVTLNVVVVEDSYEEIFVPNVFTPNAGDDLNSYFTVKGINYSCEDIDLSIFNRWGEKVYEIQNQEPRWDGTFNGTPLPEGAYYYLLKSTRIGSVHGTITLIR